VKTGYPEAQVAYLRGKADLVLWAVELHNPREYDERNENLELDCPQGCSVALLVWASADEIIAGTTRGYWRYPANSHPFTTFFDNLETVAAAKRGE
jgi:hypothetical protein